MKTEALTELLVAVRKDMDTTKKVLTTVTSREEVKVEGIIRELKLAYTNMESGRMWLGEVLYELTGKYPYAGTNDAKAPSDIQAAVDLSDIEHNVEYWTNTPIIECLGKLRKHIDEILSNIHINYMSNQYQTPVSVETIEDTINIFNRNQSYMTAYTKIKESRMILGVALGIIRDNHAND